MDNSVKTVTARAHVNIALIKYWGKKDEELKIPFCSSLSLTLDKFYTDTTIRPAEKGETSDTVYIDGVLLSQEEALRVRKYLNTVRKMYKMFGYIVVDSINNVPISAGLASSSSAFAALATALNKYLNLNLNEKQLSALARLGSGSATRSIYGGFALWQSGTNHETSYSVKVPYSNDELVMCIILVNKNKKKVSSTIAMSQSVNSQKYLNYVEENKQLLIQMLAAFKEDDFIKIGNTMQQSSDLMHQMINETGISFYEPKTVQIINKIKKIQTEIPMFYTIDAGPNVKVLTRKENVERLKDIFANEEIIVCQSGVGSYVKN